jgi:hypothetical protein
MAFFDFLKSNKQFLTFEYKLACNSCLKSDGLNHLLTVSENLSNFYENRLLLSEFKFARYIKNNLIKKKQPCEFCSSNNLEIYDIKFENKKVLIDQTVDQFQLVIWKKNEEIGVNPGGTRILPNGFLTEAFKIIKNAIEESNDLDYEEKKTGNVRFVVSTGFIGHDKVRSQRLEQFSFVGFKKNELITLINQISEEMLKHNS